MDSVNLTIGQKAPDFNLESNEGKQVTLAENLGKNIILYFYPKDDTPGCTTEAKDFSALHEQFSKLNTQIFGISKDSIASHNKFQEKYCLSIPLLSDPEGKVCESYGTWVEKSKFGKKYMGIERATFLIDTKGIIRKIWRNVSVAGHAQEILKAVQEL
jgi:peroxiredoxin Q/BCP